MRYLFYLALFYSMSFAHSTIAQPFQVVSPSVRIALPSFMPPYAQTNNYSSIVVQLINQSLAPNTQNIDYTFLSNNRLAKDFLTKKYDIAFAVPSNNYSDDIFYSNEILSFTNIVVSLASRQLNIHSTEDLATLRITAFQNAAQFLGDNFKAMSASHPHYTEIADQQTQIQLLIKGRCDVIIMEERIFWHFYRQLPNHMRSKDLKFHDIFPSSPRYLAFHSRALRDNFNFAFNKLKRQSVYLKLLALEY